MKIAIDASVHVKRLDSSEEDYKLAKELFDKILYHEINAVWSVWVSLEVQRALVKKGFSDPDEGRAEIEDFSKLGDVELVEINESVRNFALRFIKELNLYAADAVHLATAILSNSSILVSEDKHLNKKKVKKFVSKFGLEIKRLKEI